VAFKTVPTIDPRRLLESAVEWTPGVDRVPFSFGTELEGSREYIGPMQMPKDGDHLAFLTIRYQLNRDTVKEAVTESVVAFRRFMQEKGLTAADFAPMKHIEWSSVSYAPGRIDGAPVRWVAYYSLQDQAWLIGCDALRKR
jgi:hypothetical protein